MLNYGVLVVTAASAGAVTCTIHLLPALVLDPINLSPYTPDQLALINNSRALLPTLQGVTRFPSLLAMAAALPASLPAGTILPYESVLLATDTATWTTTSACTLDYAEIPPHADPGIPTPTISTTWANRATLYFVDSRYLVNPTLYDPPVSLPGGQTLYFPLPDAFERRTIQVMSAFAQQHGWSYWTTHTFFRPEYAYVYAGSLIYDANGIVRIGHYLNPRPKQYVPPLGNTPPIYTIAQDEWGVYYYDDRYTWVVEGMIYSLSPQEPSLYAVYWNQWPELTYQQGVDSYTGTVTAAAPGCWGSDIPVIVLPPPAAGHAPGIAPIVGALLVLGMMASAGAANVPLPARRRRNTA